MPPIPINSITVAKPGPAPSGGPSKSFTSRGEVTSVSNNGRHASVTVHHGRRQPPPKPTKNNPSPYPWDDRPSSNFTVSAKHAKHFGVGRKVKMTICPDDADGAGEANEEPETE